MKLEVGLHFPTYRGQYPSLHTTSSCTKQGGNSPPCPEAKILNHNTLDQGTLIYTQRASGGGEGVKKKHKTFPTCFFNTPHCHLLRNGTSSFKKQKQTKTHTNVKSKKGVRASLEVSAMYLNLIDDLGGKGSTVLTAWRAVPSQLQSILTGHKKSWDFQHSVEGCLHFSLDECYKEQGKKKKISTSAFLSSKAVNCLQTPPVLVSHAGPW